MNETAAIVLACAIIAIPFAIWLFGEFIVKLINRAEVKENDNLVDSARYSGKQ
jgi:ABC-type glycerol-3-phosphate transport system permease component